MQANPRVSVIVTCYNLGRFLPEAIDSIRRQTFRISRSSSWTTARLTANRRTLLAAKWSRRPCRPHRKPRVAGCEKRRHFPRTRRVHLVSGCGRRFSSRRWLELVSSEARRRSRYRLRQPLARAVRRRTGQWTPERADLVGLDRPECLQRGCVVSARDCSRPSADSTSRCGMAARIGSSGSG